MNRRIDLIPNVWRSSIVCLLTCFFIFAFGQSLTAAGRVEYSDTQIEEKVLDLMDRGDIPGLSIVVIRPDRPDIIKGYGVADKDSNTPVDGNTLFEIGSCAKAFTALAVLRLESEGSVFLDAPVSRYLPEFYAVYEGERNESITVRHLLRHTSGIPWNAMKYIDRGSDAGALLRTVQNLHGIELESFPGSSFQYSTVNYDIAGAIIEKASGLKYADYMHKFIFTPLGLTSTRVLQPGTEPVNSDTSLKASGHKIGFFSARRYDTDVLPGNAPAGYIVSNAKDTARWLKLQMAAEPSPLAPVIAKSHERDKTVSPDLMSISSYAYGWSVALNGSGGIYHGGDNPNFTVFFMFQPERQTAVAVLANSDSTFTHFITQTVMDMALGRDIVKLDRQEPDNGMDKSFSVISIILSLYILFTLLFIGWMILETSKGKRQYEGFNWKKLAKMFGAIPVITPFLIGIYFLPFAIRGLDWQTALPWSPISFRWSIILLLGCFIVSYIGYIYSLFFPHKNKYIRSAPMLIILSILSGGANAVVIFLVTGALYSVTPLFYMVYYFILAMMLYIIGRKIISTQLYKITYNIVYDLQMSLTDKIFLTRYQKFESIDQGRVLSTLNEDTSVVGNSATIIVTLLTSMVTTVGAFVYLASIAFWATLVTIAVIAAIAVLYYFVSQKATAYLEDARDTRDAYMDQVNGLVDGFKELSLQYKKRMQYRDDLEVTTGEFRNKNVLANVKFLNAFLVGESMLVAVLGAVSFAIPRIFPHIETFTLMSFIMVLLYLIGPINGILNSIPTIARLFVSWRRIKKFEEDIPANIKPGELEKLQTGPKKIEKIVAKGVTFEYESEEEDQKGFSVGPIDFEAKKGEVVFIVGGNGSGKTTLAKLLTGLYIPNEGEITVDGKQIANFQLGEYFSSVFSDFHLFEKLYNVDLNDQSKKDDAKEYLDILHLSGKVEFEENNFSTTDLSGGQRKRLALLKCYLEDCPVYLFDEVAADQDPEFRKFFYRELLPKMRERGKIIIAITHDDHYFDVANKVIKMDMGKIDVFTEGSAQLKVTQ